MPHRERRSHRLPAGVVDVAYKYYSGQGLCARAKSFRVTVRDPLPEDKINAFWASIADPEQILFYPAAAAAQPLASFTPGQDRAFVAALVHGPTALVDVDPALLSVVEDPEMRAALRQQIELARSGGPVTPWIVNWRRLLHPGAK